MEPSWHRPSLKNLAVLAVTISGTVAFKQWPQLMQGHAALGSSSFHRFFDAPQADSIRQCSRYYTNRSHFVGEGYRQAGWTQARWKEFGIPQTYINSHEVVLDYPEGSELTLLDLGAKSGVVLHEATLIEDLAATPGEGQLPFLPSFLAGTPAGNVTTQYVYANFGLQSDYDDLTRASISVEGKIVIAKTVFGSSLLERFNLSTSRVTQLRTAYQMKAAGLILYTDPQLDGNITEANGYRPFPHGPARPPSMIERGSAWAGRLTLSYSTYHRLVLVALATYIFCYLFGKIMFKSLITALPPGGQSVPALPISYADAIPILRALNGHGPLADSFGERWANGGLVASGVQYNVGPLPKI
jgi:N-acetylated-alpha-linked acidic dipeptidase